jgi:hypothetical protein
MMGHHSVSFTMDQYSDCWPEALTNAAEAVANLLFAASGSKTVAGMGDSEDISAEVVDLVAPPAGVEWLRINH